MVRTLLIRVKSPEFNLTLKKIRKFKKFLTKVFLIDSALGYNFPTSVVVSILRPAQILVPP